jgi:hypothetical protein
LDGPLPKMCLAVTLSHQDGHYSAVALLLKATLIQVSDYRLLGASGSMIHRLPNETTNFNVDLFKNYTQRLYRSMLCFRLL